MALGLLLFSALQWCFSLWCTDHLYCVWITCVHRPFLGNPLVYKDSCLHLYTSEFFYLLSRSDNLNKSKSSRNEQVTWLGKYPDWYGPMETMHQQAGRPSPYGSRSRHWPKNMWHHVILCIDQRKYCWSINKEVCWSINQVSAVNTWLRGVNAIGQ